MEVSLMVINTSSIFCMKSISLFLVIYLFPNSEATLSLDDKIGICLPDEEKGDVTKDSSLNKYDGELKRGKWVKGKFGGAIEFDKM